MAGTTKSELPCRREHDSRKDLHFEVVLVPPFGAFGVSYPRKQGFQGCLIFLRFLDRLLHHFKPPKWPPNHVKLGSIKKKIRHTFWGHRLGPTGIPLPPEPPSLLFQHHTTSTPLRCASRHPLAPACQGHYAGITWRIYWSPAMAEMWSPAVAVHTHGRHRLLLKAG